MPVTRICASVDCSTKVGAGWWMARLLRPVDRAGLVDRLADDVHDAAERAVADRHRDRRAGVVDLLAAHQAFGGVHGDGAHGVLAEMLGHLEHQAVAVVLGLQRVQDRRQVAVELHVDDGADDLRDAAGGVGCRLPFGSWCSVLVSSLSLLQSASAPEMISISSLVICAWRVRL